MKIFANLFFQLGITYYVMMNAAPPDKLLFYFIASFALLLIIITTDLPYWAKAILFAGFSALSGKIISVVKKVYGENAIKMAIIATMSLFFLMFVIGGMLPVLGPKFGLFLLVSLLALIVLRLYMIFGDGMTKKQRWVSIIGVALFSLFIIYDTNTILNRADYYQGDFITASMDYYLDIINLFLNTLDSSD
jgi:FtsH-binding integral membrane protein